MINFDEYTNENKTEHNSRWPHIAVHPYRILIVGGSRSGKTNTLLNLINNQPSIDKIYLYAKDTYEAKYQYLINKREKVGKVILMILKLLWNIQMICKMSTKILKITIQERTVKY